MSTVMKQAEELRLVPMDLIDTSVECRQVNKAHVERLKESIAEIGIEQPVVVYCRNGRYVLGPGRHRYEACKELEHEQIPAIVRPDATDAQIRQAQMIENLQRENMNPLEEAQACEQLLDEYQGNVDRIAAVLGRSRKWVEQRLSFARLSPRVHEMIVDGTLPLEYAYLIARVASQEKQEEIAGEVAADKSAKGTREWEDNRPESLYRCRSLVEAAMRDLKGVPWRLDVEFADKPACDNCPSNSMNQPMLFSDGKQKNPECLDQECYEHKRKICGSAVRKAVNFISKEDLAATPANAEKAAAAREVSFVNPKVVAEQAKQKAEPKKRTAAERRGRDNSETDWKLQSELRNRVNAWEENLDTQIATKMRKDHLAVGIFILIQMVPEYQEMGSYNYQNGKGKKNASIEAKVFKLLDHLKSPSAEGLVKVAKEIKKPEDSWRDDIWPLQGLDCNNDLPDSVRLYLCKIYEIEVKQEKPTMEQVKADMKKAAEPEAAAEAQPAETPAPAEAKGSKKKPTKKKKKSGKKK